MTASIDPSFHQILRYVFPEEVLEFFTITGIKETRHAKTKDMTLEVTLEEKNAPPTTPKEHRGKRIISKGFNRPQTIQDFPLRDHFCLLRVKTRRWEIDDIGTLKRTLSFLPESGLKLTTDFAAFLKEADRTRADRSRTHRETVWREEA
jgi:hypothetical protein